MSNVLESISKLKLKNNKNHFYLYLPAYCYTAIWNETTWPICPIPLNCWKDNANIPQVHHMVTTSIPLELWTSPRKEWGIGWDPP